MLVTKQSILLNLYTAKEKSFIFQEMNQWNFLNKKYKVSACFQSEGSGVNEKSNFLDYGCSFGLNLALGNISAIKLSPTIVL